MANGLRGEIDHVIDGAVWTFRPSFRAIMEIEDSLGAVLPLVQKFAAGGFGVRDVAVILWATAIEAPGTARHDLEAVGEAVIRTGIAELAAVVRELLTQILTGAGRGKPMPPVG
ncbi:gene transfer agent family protein [Govanella unica]|uniref:Gene transfer agent family protein n=1 Tax=Govanella unica TaxID=2975056 RepID=A0A9X3U029_9PROT|nr:gene transfer agent family protein [Govania unica]MDA5194951.1 gene transfer agent family protein [Govania unica]